MPRSLEDLHFCTHTTPTLTSDLENFSSNFIHMMNICGNSFSEIPLVSKNTSRHARKVLTDGQRCLLLAAEAQSKYTVSQKNAPLYCDDNFVKS